MNDGAIILSKNSNKAPECSSETKHVGQYQEAFGFAEDTTPTEITADTLWPEYRAAVLPGALLGVGTHSSVFAGMFNGQRVALKLLKQRQDLAVPAIHREISIWGTLNHPNIVQFIGVCEVHDEKSDGPAWAIVMECFPDGSLLEALHAQSLSASEKMSVATGVAKGLAYMHGLDCLHRDVAARNVFLCRANDTVTAKLGDFGLTTRCSEVWPCVISTRWAAPEVLSKNAWSTASDIYSFGVLLWEIFTDGCLPYGAAADLAEVERCVQGCDLLPQLPSISDDVYCTMRNCWVSNPGSRPSAVDVIDELSRIERVGIVQPPSEAQLLNCLEARLPNGFDAQEGSVGHGYEAYREWHNSGESAVPQVERDPSNELVRLTESIDLQTNEQ
eukprot:TRINITY_DN5629_c0_g1_i2.p1 TRINITY_DN5629_c0_g1~~TRINITY_DN5629_c0_g1_i2.p1  ORF type:complete len:407 (+),score=12.51 TRINITY_DN5629_c0_g1_i2:58-1221(+)